SYSTKVLSNILPHMQLPATTPSLPTTYYTTRTPKYYTTIYSAPTYYTQAIKYYATQRYYSEAPIYYSMQRTPVPATTPRLLNIIDHKDSGVLPTQSRSYTLFMPNQPAILTLRIIILLLAISTLIQPRNTIRGY
ncbi:Uncharacterized protein APZ42_010323, partial [Daphnia magna]